MALSMDIQSILQKSIEAMGGQSAVDKIDNISGIADCTSPNGPYVTELHSARNDRLLFKQIHPKRDPFTAIINGQYAWAIDPKTNESEALDDRSTAMIQGHDLLMLPIIWDQRFNKFKVTDAATDFEGRRCIKVQALDRLNLPCELYFDLNTSLLTGIILVNPIGKDGETVTIQFTSWQKIQNNFFPATVLITDKSGDFYFTFREVNINSLDENIFTVPKVLSKTM